MNELYFTYRNRKTTRVIRLEFGQVDKEYFLKTYEGVQNQNGLFMFNFSAPREEFFEHEQEMLKKVSETKKGLMECRWVIQKKESSSQPSFIETKIIDGEISVKFK